MNLRILPIKKRKPEYKKYWKVIDDGRFYPNYFIDSSDFPSNILTPDEWFSCNHNEYSCYNNLIGTEITQFKHRRTNKVLLLLKLKTGEYIIINKIGCRRHYEFTNKL